MKKTKVVVDISVNGCQPRPSLKNFIVGCLKPMVPNCLFKDITCKYKVMKIAATLPRVEKVSIEEEKNLLTVIGEGIDTVELVNLLRKKVGFAKIVSQGEEKVDKEKEKEKEKPKDEEKVVHLCNCNNNRVMPMAEMWEVRDPYYNHSCFPLSW